jgi:hypothetical protein
MSKLITMLIFSSACALAQDQDWRSAIQDRLESQYVLTKATDDRSTIVTAGAVLVLKKDDLLMFTIELRNSPGNTYKDGKITQGLLGKLGRLSTDGSTRTFVKGEKFWVTRINVKDDGVVFQLLSDEFGDTRYGAALKFPFSKSAPPTAEQMEKTVSQVLRVDGSDETAPEQPVGKPAAISGKPGQSSAFVAEQQETAPAPIAPPAPPADQPPAPPQTLSLGQTKEQIFEILGQPLKVANLGTKQIYFYKDLKVTVVSGKVTDIE